MVEGAFSAKINVKSDKSKKLKVNALGGHTLGHAFTFALLHLEKCIKTSLTKLKIYRPARSSLEHRKP